MRLKIWSAMDYGGGGGRSNCAQRPAPFANPSKCASIGFHYFQFWKRDRVTARSCPDNAHSSSVALLFTYFTLYYSLITVLRHVSKQKLFDKHFFFFQPLWFAMFKKHVARNIFQSFLKGPATQTQRCNSRSKEQLSLPEWKCYWIFVDQRIKKTHGR